MSVTQSIMHLNDYAKSISEDESFKEFSHALFIFSEKIKNEKNINDKDIFTQELQKELLKNYESDEAYKEFFFTQAGALALEVDSNGDLDIKKYYENFKNAYKKFQEEERLKEESLQENQTNLENLSEEDKKEELINELFQNLDFNESYSTEKEDLNHQIASYENALLDEGFIEPLEEEFKEEAEEVKPSELIAFIKDEKQISYPFNREDTLKNASFMRGFRKELNALGTKELEEMISAMKAKNEALRKELDELKNKKEGLLRQLEGEMVANSNLSLAKDELEATKEEQMKEELDEVTYTKAGEEQRDNRLEIRSETNTQQNSQEEPLQEKENQSLNEKSNALLEEIAQKRAEADKMSESRANFMNDEMFEKEMKDEEESKQENQNSNENSQTNKIRKR
ncbi:V-type ATP synthase subunit I domain-containing protein [Campylobacter helveticus]|uniref:Uncharacterized protein n=1 Tax=Campylobacter helveticus TaxID=28898 RepID=A0AAX2UH98_9BACT|nr:hypothetical protein [Campylobacter helveticus]TNB56384.1 hypothetical protein FDW42_07455 [Campylobacter helveticus]